MLFWAVLSTTPAVRIEISTVGPHGIILPLIVPIGASASSTGITPSISSTSLEAIVASALVASATSIANIPVITDESLLEGSRCKYIIVNVGRLTRVEDVATKDLSKQ